MRCGACAGRRTAENSLPILPEKRFLGSGELGRLEEMNLTSTAVGETFCLPIFA